MLRVVMTGFVGRLQYHNCPTPESFGLSANHIADDHGAGNTTRHFSFCHMCSISTAGDAHKIDELKILNTRNDLAILMLHVRKTTIMSLLIGHVELTI